MPVPPSSPRRLPHHLCGGHHHLPTATTGRNFHCRRYWSARADGVHQYGSASRSRWASALRRSGSTSCRISPGQISIGHAAFFGSGLHTAYISNTLPIRSVFFAIPPQGCQPRWLGLIFGLQAAGCKGLYSSSRRAEQYILWTSSAAPLVLRMARYRPAPTVLDLRYTFAAISQVFYVVLGHS